MNKKDKPMAKILSDKQIERLLSVDDDTAPLSESLKPNTKFEKKLLLALDKRFAAVRSELEAFGEQLEMHIQDIEERLESDNASSNSKREVKKELSEIKEMLAIIKKDTKYLRIQKAASEAAPYYENEQLQEENEMLKAELGKLRAAIGYGSKRDEGDGSHEQ